MFPVINPMQRWWFASPRLSIGYASAIQRWCSVDVFSNRWYVGKYSAIFGEYLPTYRRTSPNIGGDTRQWSADDSPNIGDHWRSISEYEPMLHRCLASAIFNGTAPFLSPPIATHRHKSRENMTNPTSPTLFPQWDRGIRYKRQCRLFMYATFNFTVREGHLRPFIDTSMLEATTVWNKSSPGRKFLHE